LVKGGFKFLEGPVWFANLGVLFFSDMNFHEKNDNGPPSLMHRLTPPSTVEDFIPASGTNGLAIAPDGRILAATHDIQSLAKFDPISKARTNIDLAYQGKHFNSPNDLAVRSDGNVYFSDPSYQLGSRTSETTTTGVYRVSPAGEVLLVDDKQRQPNGITLSVDETTLYVSNGQGTIVKYAVSADGSTGPPAKFVDASSDGMTKDCAGNLYTTNANQQTVDVYDPAGAKIGSITGVAACTNVAFGGADRKTLYITAGPDQSGALYSVQLEVSGYPY
jgi:gluconolactonase